MIMDEFERNVLLSELHLFLFLLLDSSLKLTIYILHQLNVKISRNKNL